ncbi:hypothetical protein [Erwinia sp. 198]|uniref:hypothetical protein n=1 Tax=Erwinia sp. 198 TaxID=2022746 RepID=UPI000F6625F9|nr:hypothetical protein [Erwinia sp. 198]
MKLKNIHLPHRLFREIFGQRQSIASMNIKSMQMIGLSPIFEGWDFYSEIHASVALINKNSFIFCISLLNSPELANNIFKDYNDKWFFNEQVTHMVAYEMANQIKKEVIKRQEKSTSVFFDKFNEKKYRSQISDTKNRI